MDELTATSELFARQEPLLPELQLHVVPSPFGGLMLHHPFVIEPWLDLNRCAWINRSYRRKAKQAKKYLAAGEFFNFIFIHERPYRLGAFIRCVPGLVGGTKGLVGADFGRVLRDVWLDCENVRQHRRLWRDAWHHDAEGRQHCMSAEEHAAVAALPDLITVWRGVSYFTSTSIKGFSWSLDRDKGIWFARRYARQRRRAWLVEGEVEKKDVLAHFLTSEREIVSMKVQPRQITDVTDDHEQ